MEENQSLNYMLYLQYDQDLDRSYFLLSAILRQLNISLIPIQIDEVKLLEKNKRYHAIMVRKKYNDALRALDWKKRFLDSAMLSGRIVLHDISSFSELSIPASLEKKGAYFFTGLPVDYKKVAMDLVVNFYNDKNNTDVWPGGKRAKLFEADKIKTVKLASNQ